MAEPKQDDVAKCVNCGRDIIYCETPIDYFWTHQDNRIGFCWPEKDNFMTAEDWAWPKEEADA